MKRRRPPVLRLSLDPGSLVVDNFAGGGGASSGIEDAIGRPPDIAINHDPEAIAMHRANHPRTKHYCESIQEVDPREACGTRRVGLAWFSPDCGHFSKAKGSKPVDKNIRGLAWVVVRWAATVRPDVIIVENVEEFEGWGPLDADGYPIKARAGETFREWVAALREFGYEVAWRPMVAADFGTPTTRRRLFVVARCDGRPIVWPEPSHGKGRAKAWRPAADVIDWSLPVRSIFNRERPLKDATLRRIAVGVRRYVLEAAQPFIIPTTHQGDLRVHSLDDPLRTVTGAKRGELAIVGPTLIQTSWGERPGQAPRVPGLEKPLGTVVAGGIKHALVAPLLLKHYGGVVGHRLDDRPIGTVTTQDHHSLAAAFLVKQNFGQKPCSAAGEPLHTVTTQGNRHNLAAAFLTKYYGTSVGADVGAPMPTVLAGGGRGGHHLAEVRAFLVKYYGTASGQGLLEPLHTATTRARFGLVTIAGVDYQVVDIGMRMLHYRELFAAQGFRPDYKIDVECRGKPLTQTAKIRMAGNAVCREPARDLVAAQVRAA